MSDALIALCTVLTCYLGMRLGTVFLRDCVEYWRDARRAYAEEWLMPFQWCSSYIPFFPLVRGMADELKVKAVYWQITGDSVEVDVSLHWWGDLAWWDKGRLKEKCVALLAEGGVHYPPGRE